MEQNQWLAKVPSWLLSASFFLLIALLSISFAREQPFEIWGKRFGFTQQPKFLLSGEVAKSGDQTDWNLLKGTGTRKSIKHVTFDPPFKKPPKIVVGLRLVDYKSGQSKLSAQKFSVYPENITKSGFDMVFQTWCDNQVWALTATWLAYQE